MVIKKRTNNLRNDVGANVQIVICDQTEREEGEGWRSVCCRIAGGWGRKGVLQRCMSAVLRASGTLRAT